MADQKPEIDTPSIDKNELQAKIKANAEERKQLEVLRAQFKLAELTEARLRKTQVVQPPPKPAPTVESMPTAPTDVDWTKSNEVKLPTLAPAPMETVETPQQRRNSNFLRGFDQGKGKPSLLFVNLESGRKPGSSNP